jgi:hypothetical protein
VNNKWSKVRKSLKECDKSHPHRARHHIYHYVYAMVSYVYDVCTPKPAVLMKEYSNITVLDKAFCGPN